MTERNADVSKTLTEQWEKGELPEAWYYVKDIHNKESLDRYFKETDNFEYLEDWEVGEVLASVPSYEECKASYNCMLENEVLRLKNTKLKELLKECQGYFEAYKRGEKCVECRGEFYNIWELALKGIDQALGEK